MTGEREYTEEQLRAIRLLDRIIQRQVRQEEEAERKEQEARLKELFR